MLRAHVSSSSGVAAKYFTRELVGDRLEPEHAAQAIGRWAGKFAEQLRLSGVVQYEQFRRLCANIHPEADEHLTPRTKANRRAGVDITFNVPKSVSLAWALLEDERIPEAVQRSGRRTMEAMEREAATRVRLGGKSHDRSTESLVWAEYLHETSRPVGGFVDPNLHLHCYVFNVTHDETERRNKAVQFGPLFKKLPLYEAVFHNHLAREILSFGYEVESTGRFWEIAGFPRPLIERYSLRSKVIDEIAKTMGLENNPKAKDGLGPRTRERKPTHRSRQREHAEWRERVGEFWAQLDKVPEGGGAPKDRTREAIQRASAQLLERRAVVTEAELFEAAMRVAPGRVDPRTFTTHYQEIGLLQRTIDHKSYITSLDALAEERELLALAKETQKFRQVTERWGVKHETPSTLAEKIAGAVDGLIIVEGIPGTGKTTLARQVDAMVRQRWSKLVVLAPTSEASRGTLRDHGFKGAETVARFLINEKLQKASAGHPLWIDEAGLVSTQDLCQVLRIAARNLSPVILVGDRDQHRSVSRGGCLYPLAKHADIEVLQMGAVKRQRGVFKEIVEAMADGRGTDVMTALDRAGVLFRDTVEATMRRAVVAYVKALQEGRKVGLYTATNAEREALNTLVREERSNRREIGISRKKNVLESLGRTVAEKGRADTYNKGEVIVFSRYCRVWPGGTQFVPGQPWYVVGHDMFGNVKLERGIRGGGRPLEIVKHIAGATKLERGVFVGSLPLKYAKHFDVFQERNLYVARGDIVQITRNTRVESLPQKIWNNLPKNKRKVYGELTNGSCHEVLRRYKDGRIKISSGHTLDADFPFLRYGYASTTYTAQSATKDLAIVSLTKPLVEDNHRMLNVALSRGKETEMYVASNLDLESLLHDREKVVTATEVRYGTDPEEQGRREERRRELRERERLLEQERLMRERSAQLQVERA